MLIPSTQSQVQRSGYDALDRLTADDQPAQAADTLNYDLNGNRTSDQNGNRTLEYNNAGRLFRVYEGTPLIATYT